MAEPTAREALLSVAERFAVKASTEQRGPYAVHVWWQAAEIARSLAQESPASPADPPAGNREGADGERLSVDLSAAGERRGSGEDGGPDIDAAWVQAGAHALANAEADLADSTIRLYPRSYRSTLALAVVQAVVLAIRADERARLRALLPYHVPCCPDFAASVADLLNDHGDSP